MAVCETTVSCLLVYSVTLVVSTAACAVLAAALYLHHLHRKLAHLPSPPWDGFVRGHISSINKYIERGEPIAQALLDMANQCGPVYSIFLFHVSFVHVCDRAAVKELLLTEANTKPAMSYKVFHSIYSERFLGNGLVSQLDPVKHARRRTLLNPMFTRKYLVSFIGQFNASADLLVEKLLQKADGKTEVVMLEELNKTTLDVIAKVAFGQDLNIINDDNATFDQDFSRVLASMREYHNLWLTMSPFAAQRKYRKAVRDSIRFLRKTGQHFIEQRLEALEKQEEVPNDILTRILEEYKQQDGTDPLTIEDLVDECLTFFFAGQETTANLLAFCLLALGNHPEVTHRLKTEVDAILGERDNVEKGDIDKMTYMMQVLKETLRLWPPVTGAIRQLDQEMTVQGHKIPKGAQVSVNSYVMCRMEEYFHNAQEFDPDRFKASEDTFPYTYFPFSLGSRNCIGQQFAMIEARVLLAKLLHKFHFDLVPGQGYLINDSITLKPLKGCRNYIRLVDN